MTKNLVGSESNQNLCSEIEGFSSLQELALNISCTWDHSLDKIWESLDPELWELTHNPWLLMQSVSKEKLTKTLSDPEFRKVVEKHLNDTRRYAEQPAWFQKNYPDSPLKGIAYFSMEYMLSEALPIYSGGLGNVAGDQLKTANDLGVPVYAVGLLYQRGYFRQLIDKDGNQQALYPYNDPGQLPITPLRRENGEWLRLEIAFPGWKVWIRTWKVKVGRVHLLLLDTNDSANLPIHRGITSELYGGGPEMRLMQEMLLGITGWRLLTELGVKPEVCHLNEGHAAFAVLERARCFMAETGLTFEEALAATRAGNLFTTHTAVPAGFDRFSPALIEQYLGDYARQRLKISTQELLALGRRNPSDCNEEFNMAYLAMRGSMAVNGVSKLHGKVSQGLFASLFPRWPVDEVPVGSVTNGVHMPSWDSEAADKMWGEHCGQQRWLLPTEQLGKHILDVNNEELWKMRNDSRVRLVDYARFRLSRQMAARGAPLEDIESLRRVFDYNTLTLGFARRFATYKRPNMLLQDPERLLRILSNPQRPVQLVLAGKAHPADLPGRALIQEWMKHIFTPEWRSHVIFLSDYDMYLTEILVQGVDVWINTPRRPWEACGTSGMKVLVNGGINLSELDGWWAEAYTPDVGWAIGDMAEHGVDPAWDAAEANRLYDILENEVIPEFYDRDDNGIPHAWIKRMKASMSKLTPEYSANRAVRQYTTQYYLPAAVEYQKRTANKGETGKQIVKFNRSLKDGWDKIRFSKINIDSTDEHHKFEIRVYLDGIDVNNIKVQLYIVESDGLPNTYDMKLVRNLVGDPNTYAYSGTVSAQYPADYYTARVVPNLEGLSVPLESNYIMWQK